jgi:photosystem II stability/assembly factor-like uncharacterized protein
MQADFHRRTGSLITLALLCLAIERGPGRTTAPPTTNPSGHLPASVSLPTWVSLAGPTVSGGNVDAIAVSRSDPNRLYSLLTGPAGERLFRSDDAALNWQAIFTFTASVTQLAVDPAVTSTVYAGAPDGLFRSIDNGLHWSPVYTIGQEIVVVSPTLMYAAGPLGPPDGTVGCAGNVLGVARSMDAGVSWQVRRIGCGDWMTGLAVSPTNPNRVYASKDQDPSLVRSDDGGQTWHPLPLATDVPSSQASDLAIDPQNAARLYASDFGGVIVSTDEGQTWRHTLGQNCGECRLVASGGSVYAIHRAPDATPAPIYRSDDGGQTWWTSVQLLPAAASVLAADPVTAGVLYAGAWRYGVYKSLSRGGSWTELDQGIASLAPIRALAQAHQAGIIYAAVDQPRGGMFHTTVGGQIWTEALTGTFPIAVVTSPLTPTRAYATTGGDAGVYETQDGQSWSKVLTKPIPALHIDALALPAHDSERPYFGGGDKTGYVLQRQPGQSYWGINFLFETTKVAALVTDPLNPLTLYAGTDSGYSGKGATVYRSDDAGLTWSPKLNDSIQYGTNALAIDPMRTTTIYASSALIYGIVRSDDRGEHWRGFSTGLPVSYPSANALIVDELGTAYAAKDNGVYRWDQAQGQWVLFGPAGRTVWSLAIVHSNPELLLAGTDMGIWEISLPRWQIWLPIAAR